MAAPSPGGPATSPPAKAGSKKIVILVIVAVLVAAAAGVVAFVLLSTPPTPTPTQVNRFQVTPSKTNPLTGEGISLTVRALRADGSTMTEYGGEVIFSSDDDLADLPPQTVFGPGDAGERTFSGVILRKAGTVTITVRDADVDAAGFLQVDVLRPTGAPIATFSAIRTLMRVIVNASESTDPNDAIASYEWDFQNDRTFDATGVEASYTYSTPGRYSIRLRVTDVSGGQDNASRRVSVAQSTIDYEFFDFFEIPFQEYWDIRQANYFEAPINAECFNASSILEGICEPTDPDVPDVATYPYTHWWSAQPPGYPAGVPFLYTRYRMNAQGVNVPGYNLSEPVYLWVRDYSAPPGERFDLTWRLSYLNNTRATEVGTWCATNFVFGNDGYILESNINITMDIQESRRIFGVVATDPASAQAWWDSTTTPLCRTKGALETSLQNWFAEMGGFQLTVGKYDIASGYEWYYQPFTTNINATVDPATGLTWVNISHTAYGTEVLLGRWFYWGNTSYEDNWADSTKRRGWIGMEIAWYEDLVFRASLGPSGHDFTLSTSMAYHFQNVCTPGANGIYDRVDDVPVWTWGPMLDDYIHDWGPSHPISELDRYTDETYVQCAPGAPTDVYGQDQPLDVTPITWDLPAGETWTFRFPTGSVVFYDPNNTPPGAVPTYGEIAEIRAPLQFAGTTPLAFGEWDPVANTWTVIGPSITGGPDGSPGNYALQPWPLIDFTPGPTASPTAGAAYAREKSASRVLTAVGEIEQSGTDPRRVPGTAASGPRHAMAATPPRTIVLNAKGIWPYAGG